MTASRYTFAIALLLTASCAGSSRPPENGAAPASAREPYAGKCSFVRLEELESGTDSDSDAVSVVARYRFDDGASAPASGWNVFFLLSRSRVQDVGSRLAAHPTVLCSPEHIEAPAIEGRQSASLQR
ncbi:MAG TPA: hypothetical protein VHM19_21525 [Polyangiales bacterium]|jgi:hypothetical protein|nr:hypothetical protein [Polyangiales bacterium]